MKGQLAKYLTTDYSTSPTDIALEETDKRKVVKAARMGELGDPSCLTPIPPLSSYATIVANLLSAHDGMSAKDFLELLIFKEQARRLKDEEEME